MARTADEAETFRGAKTSIMQEQFEYNKQGVFEELNLFAMRMQIKFSYQFLGNAIGRVQIHCK